MRKPVQVLAAAAVLFGAAAGISYATNAVTRTATSVLQACSNDTNGNLRLVGDAQTDCRTNETGVSWNVVGPPGPPGADGADGVNGVNGTDGVNGTNGVDGTNGISPTVRQLDPTDPNCGGGGVAITDAAGHVGYVCNGAKGDTGAAGSPFAGTFASPSGLFSLTVADTGIELRGPTGRIRLDPGSLEVRADTALTIRSGANLLLESSGQATLKGAQVIVGSSNCAPPLRQGDSMFVVVPPGQGGGLFPVTTVPTPSVVCIG